MTARSTRHVALNCGAPDASSGVARRACNEALTRISALRDNSNLTRRIAPRGGRGVRPYTGTHD